MPHSSGGGHGGGGHGGGSHGGHGGGSSGPRMSRSHFAGSRRYSYYHRGRMRYIYSEKDPSKMFHPARLLIGIFYLPFIFFAGSQLFSPMRLSPAKDTEIIIEDDANVLGDTGKLQNSLDAFKEKSKVIPGVVTVNNSDWQGHYASLEDYAYDRYLQEFTDEQHWLIVYSAPDPVLETQEEPDAENSYEWDTSYPYADEWYWEGMQGDDTDDVLNSSVTAAFNSKFQGGLEVAGDSVANNLSDAFDTATAKLKTPRLIRTGGQSATSWFILAFVAFHAYFMLGLNTIKYRKATLDPDPETDPILKAETANQRGWEPPSTDTQRAFPQAQPFGTQQTFGAQQPQGYPAPQQTFGTQQQGYPAQQPSFGIPAQGFGAPQQTYPAPQPTAPAQQMQQPQPFAMPPGYDPPTVSPQPQQSFAMPQRTPAQSGGQAEMPDLMIPPSFDTPAAPAQQQSFAMPQGFDVPEVPAQPQPFAMPQGFDVPEVPTQPQSFAMPQGFDDPQQQAFDAQQRAFEAQQKAFETQQQSFRMMPGALQRMLSMAGVRYCPSCGTELTQR